MTRAWNGVVVLAALGAATGCHTPAEAWIRDDAVALLSCDVSRMMITWEGGRHSEDAERGFMVLCLSIPVELIGPGPGSAGGEITAWATYTCPSLNESLTLMGVLFGRCELVGHGLGEPGPDDSVFTLSP